MLADVGRVDIQAEARAIGNLNFSINDFERRCFALKFGARFKAFGFMMRHWIAKGLPAL
jgi:hypothetical protein